MQFLKYLLILAVLNTAACANTKMPMSNQETGANCSNIPDIDKLNIYLHYDALWHKFHFADRGLTGNEMARGENPDRRIERNTSNKNFHNSISEQYPGISDVFGISKQKLGYPAKMSPDGQWLAATLIDTGDSTNLNSKQLIIRSILSKRETVISAHTHIATLAWSPKSSHLAIVELTYAPSRSAKSFTAALFGWKLYQSDVTVAVFDPFGSKSCHATVIENVTEVSALMDWGG